MPAYVLFLRDRTTDESEMELYRQKAPLARPGHAMTPRAFYGRIRTLEGLPAEGAVVLEFPTFEEAENWYESDAYQDALQHRLKGADYRVVIVEGVAPAG